MATVFADDEEEEACVGLVKGVTAAAADEGGGRGGVTAIELLLSSNSWERRWECGVEETTSGAGTRC